MSEKKEVQDNRVIASWLLYKTQIRLPLQLQTSLPQLLQLQSTYGLLEQLFYYS